MDIRRKITADMVNKLKHIRDGKYTKITCKRLSSLNTETYTQIFFVIWADSPPPPPLHSTRVPKRSSHRNKAIHNRGKVLPCSKIDLGKFIIFKWVNRLDHLGWLKFNVLYSHFETFFSLHIIKTLYIIGFWLIFM